MGSHKKILYKVAYTYCKNSEDRRDLIQEMIIQLWKSFPGFDRRVQFSTWMYRVAMNVAISFYRNEKRRIRDTVPFDDLGLDIGMTTTAFEEEGDNMRVLRQLIDDMDEMNRGLILLFLDGFSQEEIAQTLGLSVTNVATRISRIKQKLQSQFKQHM